MGAKHSKAASSTATGITENHRPKKIRSKSFSLRKFKSSRTSQENDKKECCDLFELLSDDVMLHIFSYVSTIPRKLYDNGEFIEEDYTRLWQSYNEKILKTAKKEQKQKSESTQPSTALPSYQPPLHFLFDEAEYGKSEESPCQCENELQPKGKSKQKRPNGLVSSPKTFGTLTHVLPLVSRRFHQLCNQNSALWVEALENLMEDHAPPVPQTNGAFQVANRIWRNGVLKMILDRSGNEKLSQDQMVSNIDLPSKDVIDLAFQIHRKFEQNDGHLEDDNTSSARRMFLDIVFRYRPLVLPVLFLPSRSFSRHENFEIMLQQSMHCILIDNLMETRSPKEAMGGIMVAPRPRMLVAYQERPSLRRKVAALVEVTQCWI